MEYRTLTGAGIDVSTMCLGTMTFGAQVDEVTSIRMVDMALDAGVNFIDTADVYNGGRAETILGKALKGKRDRLILAGKVAIFFEGDEMKDSGLNRWHIIKGVEASLKRLNTECLDICYLHEPDAKTPIEEPLRAFDALVQQGQVMSVGMSNYAAWQVCEAMWRCDLRGWAPPVVVQIPYNIIRRSIDEECVAFCSKMNMGMTVYNPLAAGLLTGKHSRSKSPEEGTRLATNEWYRGLYWQEANFDALESLLEIAGKAGKTLTELSLQWLAAQPHVSSIVIGASKPEQLEENLKAWDGKLETETLAACDQMVTDLSGRRGGADIVLEVSGASEVYDYIFDLIRYEGRLVTIGHPSQPVSIDMSKKVNQRGISIKGIFGRRIWETWHHLADAVASRKIDLARIITHRFVLREYEKAFEQTRGDSAKILLIPASG